MFASGWYFSQQILAGIVLVGRLGVTLSELVLVNAVQVTSSHGLNLR